MLVFLINRTRPDLTPEQYGRLAELAKAFYANVPPGVSLRGEWAAADYSRNFSLLEAPDVATVEADGGTVPRVRRRGHRAGERHHRLDRQLSRPQPAGESLSA